MHVSLSSIASGFVMMGRPRATSGGASVAPLVGPFVVLLLMLVLVGLSVWVLVARGGRVRDAASRAFAPLGLVPRRWGITGWQASGNLHGRPCTVVLSAGARNAPSSLIVEVASSVGFDVSIQPPLSSAGTFVRSLISNGTEVAAPGFPPRSVHSGDPRRAHTLVTTRLAGLQRMLSPRTQGQVVYLFVTPGRVKLQILGDAWQTLTPESLRADLDELVALATAAEHLQ